MAMDPVNKKAVKKDFKNRNDKDIDNDGDVDSSDEYLHKRRKAVSKAIKNVKESFELAESDFSVGQKVEYEAPDGGEYYGTVIKLDKPEEGAYYHVKLENGKVVKASPGQLEAEDDDDEDDDKEDMKESVDLEEKVYSSDYNVGHEKSQFGGYRPHVTHKKTGKTMYLGQTSYKKPEHAKGHAAAYLKGYEQVGDKTANRHANEYEKANKQHVYKEEVELDEKAESQAQAIAARIALKHKRKDTKPEAGTASADMMKMSEKDLEDYTKVKKDND